MVTAREPLTAMASYSHSHSHQRAQAFARTEVPLEARAPTCSSSLRMGVGVSEALGGCGDNKKGGPPHAIWKPEYLDLLAHNL